MPSASRRDPGLGNGGTAQRDRFPEALRDDYFKVDERSFEDLIARTAEFAKTIAYYDDDGLRDGSWRELFASDEIVVMAQIAATDSARMESEFLPLLDDAAASIGYLIGFALRIDGWYRRLLSLQDEPARMIRRQIEVVVDRKLKAALADIASALQRSGREEVTPARIAPLFAGFHPIWGFSGGSARSVPEAAKTLRTAFYSLVGAISILKPIAAEAMQASLSNGRHNPAVALFVAFARLFGQATAKLNRFTARHRDFYYDSMLRMGPKPQSVDSTFLVLTAEAGRKPFIIPAGTDFTAGKVAGGELIYRSASDLLLSDAEVRSLRTLNRRRDPQISPENQLNFIDALRSAELPCNAGTVSWPLFGAATRDTPAPAEDVSAGFAIASPLLRLREGERTIDVTVSFGLPDLTAGDMSFGEQFRRMVLSGAGEETAFAEAARAKFDNPNDLLRQDAKTIFDLVMRSVFDIAVTVKSRWYDIADYRVSSPDHGRADLFQLCFTLRLGPEVPALAAYDAKSHGGGFDTSLPLLRFCLNPQGMVYGYSLFEGLTVESIDIKTSVADATALLLWNQNGQLDASKPFAPFGPLPTTNSYLVIGHYDAAGMPLTAFSLSLEWGDLPSDPNGFSSYYKGYETSYSNGIFLGGRAVLRDGSWRVDGSSPLFPGPEGQRPAPVTEIEVDVLKSFKRIDASLPEAQFRYDQKARNGFFRLSLTEPDWAFGHRDYPGLLTAVLAENARPSLLGRRRPQPLPNPPYTPMINRISVSYSAATSLRAGASQGKGPFAEQLYHLHPFGVAKVATDRPWVMLPAYEFDGNLFIGFSASQAGGPLSLLFLMREESVTSIAAPEPSSWFYLASDQWRPLGKDRLLSDGTSGFLTSGVVTVDLPEDIDRANSVMPNDLYWLRISAQANFSSFCSCYGVQTQAVQVVRLPTPQAPAVMAAPLPVGAVKGPVATIPGLRAVAQPMPSTGGLVEETPQQKIARTAERLRHKARAVTPWDYERLVLDAFPEVFLAKCFPALSSSALAGDGRIKPQPGKVLVVVVPYRTQTLSAMPLDPLLDAITLRRIQDYLRRIASGQAQIEVRNPSYERLLIRCEVRLTESAQHQRGTLINQLNQAIVDYISPWSETGPAPRFGWSFLNDEVKAFVQSLPYVAEVTDFSILRISRDEAGKYRLDDTARPDALDPSVDGARLSPRFPWGLAIPCETHLLAIAERRDDTDAPTPTGIGLLDVGNSFIIQENRR